MRTSNPVLHEKVFKKTGSYDFTQTMTMQGTTIKTFLLLCLTTLSAGWVWSKFADISIITHLQTISYYVFASLILAFIIAIVTCLAPSWSLITAPIYALLEGVFLGAFSLVVDRQYPGIIPQALSLTLAVLAVMLVIYSLGIINVTHRLRMIVASTTGAVCLVYALSFILRFFHIPMPFIHESGTVGILLGLFMVTIAAFNLLLDFDLIHRAQKHGAPKYMEWYGAFALMVTLIWLYVEILHLLIKLRQRKRR